MNKRTYNFSAFLFLAVFCIAGCFMTAISAMAEDIPNTSFCVKGGDFEPDYWPLDRGYDFGNLGVGYAEMAISWIVHQTFEVGVEVGYANYLIPVDIDARYRFNYMDDQVLVPFLGAGVDYYHLRDEKVIAKEDRDGDKWKYGYHAAFGVQVLLDYFSPHQARDMKDNWGVANTYLNLEAKFSVVDNFGNDELDLGGSVYTAGLRFEY